MNEKTISELAKEYKTADQWDKDFIWTKAVLKFGKPAWKAALAEVDREAPYPQVTEYMETRWQKS